MVARITRSVLELPKPGGDDVAEREISKGGGHFGTWHPTITGKEIEYPFPNSFYSYATQIAQVLVNLETGQVTVEKVWAAHDVGKAINPIAVEGQIDGGVQMGVGYALYEELQMQEGRLLNDHLAQYVMPDGLGSTRNRTFDRRSCRTQPARLEPKVWENQPLHRPPPQLLMPSQMRSVCAFTRSP